MLCHQNASVPPSLLSRISSVFHLTKGTCPLPLSLPISAPGGSPDPSVLACVGFSPTCGLLRWKPNISSPSAPCLLTPGEGFLPSLLVGRVLEDRTCLEIPQVKASCHQPPTPLFYFIFFHRSELGRTLAVRPEVSPGGGRFGAALAKTSRVARQKKKKGDGEEKEASFLLCE